jgi:hypothetical protein
MSGRYNINKCSRAKLRQATADWGSRLADVAAPVLQIPVLNHQTAKAGTLAQLPGSVMILLITITGSLRQNAYTDSHNSFLDVWLRPAMRAVATDCQAATTARTLGRPANRIICCCCNRSRQRNGAAHKRAGEAALQLYIARQHTHHPGRVVRMPPHLATTQRRPKWRPVAAVKAAVKARTALHHAQPWYGMLLQLCHGRGVSAAALW